MDQAGLLLSLIMSGQAPSRTALARETGLSRTTIGHRLDRLFHAGLIREIDERMPSGGRPARVLKLDPDFGVVLAAVIGETRIRTAVTDLSTNILSERLYAFDYDSGPTAILAGISERFHEQLAALRPSARRVVGIGLSMPAPIDFRMGRAFGPSIMRGFDNFDVRGFMHERFRVPVIADNDVNLMTVAEHRQFWPEADQLFFIKAGTGIGSGIIAGGGIYRGAQGAAGDVGHIQLDDADPPPLCRCGKLGCVEARSAGWALARDLRAKGFQAHNARDVIALVRANNPEAVRLVRAAGRILGKVAADIVSVLNPSVIVIGGTLAGADEHLLAGIREFVYPRCLPLATRKLTIGLARSGEKAGIVGAAQLVIDAQLAPSAVGRILARRGRPAEPLAAAS